MSMLINLSSISSSLLPFLALLYPTVGEMEEKIRHRRMGIENSGLGQAAICAAPFHYVKNGPKLRHNVSTLMSKISMLRALDAPKTLYRFDPHISRLKILPVAIVQSGA